jgi:predicted ATPase
LQILRQRTNLKRLIRLLICFILSNNLMRFRNEDNFRHYAFAFLRRRKKYAACRRFNRKHFVALNFHFDAVPKTRINAAEVHQENRTP